VGCGRCVEACPGNLIKLNEERRAEIRHPRDCWGCTSCIKECPAGVIQFFLGADIGGNGGTLSVSEKNEWNIWTFRSSLGEIRTIEVNKKDSNKY
jgi:adenylylsulfate reductase subunit B